MQRSLKKIANTRGSALSKRILSINRTALNFNKIMLAYSSTSSLGPSLSIRYRSFSSEATKTLCNADVKFSLIPELQTNVCKAFPNNNVFGTRSKEGKYEWITYREFDRYVNETRKILATHDVKYDSKVALISNNRVEWASILYATTSLGAQLVPMYEAQLEKDWKYIIEDSEASVLVVANEKIYNQVKGYVGQVGKIQHILCLDAPETASYSYAGWMKKVSSQPAIASESLPSLTVDDVAIIIYTSGTTGKPKGVELTHGNIVSNVQGCRTIYKDQLTHKDGVTTLAFLPWAHVYGLTAELQAIFSVGGSMAIIPNRDLILEGVQSIRPSSIMSVPILFNKIYDGVMKNVATQSPLKQALFHRALATARRRNHALEYGEPVSPWLAWQFSFWDLLVLSKIRERLGGRLRYMGAGGAAANLEVLKFFEDIGVPICEGYGLTETSPIITAGAIAWSGRRLGTVGVALPGVTVKIIQPDTLEEMPPGMDGEVVCSGPNVMKGYRNAPEANKEVFFYQDGLRYFRTGDMGRMIENKFLKITGRIKEQFKLENGKYVVPAPLEDIYARGPFIAQCCLIGANRPHTILLVVPNYVELLAHAKGNDSLIKLIEEVQELSKQCVSQVQEKEKIIEQVKSIALFSHSLFVQVITDEIKRHGKGCKHYEQPSLWYPILQPFSPENQLLTPKLSLRRNNVHAIYEQVVEGVYTVDVQKRLGYVCVKAKEVEEHHQEEDKTIAKALKP